MPAAFGPDDQLRARAELGLQRVVAAEAGQRTGESSRLASSVGPVDGERLRQDVVRTGMTTWT